MKTILTIYFAIICCSIVKGQGLFDENYVSVQNQKMEVMRQHFNNIANNAYVNQIGEVNELISVKQSVNVERNMVYLAQQGLNNYGYIGQVGTINLSGLVQNGKQNEANLWSEGFSTQNIVVQIGNNNLVNQFIENYYAVTRSAVAVQLGNDNKIELALLDSGEPNNLMGAMVTQTGDANSAELVLNQSDASYMTVNQSGGAEIKVTQSDFYFPMK